jgi:ribosomal protein S14
MTAPLLPRLPRLTREGTVPVHRQDLGPCLVWTGHVRPDGYARVALNGRMEPAHRAVYEALVGPIPSGLHLDHLCRVPHCVRPSHLEPVTQAENNRRAAEARVPKSICVNGHELVGDNVRVTSGKRRCVICTRAKALAYYHRSVEGTVRRPAAERIACPQGHPYDEVNTLLITRPNGGVNRTCRECGRERNRARRLRLKASA